MRDTRVQALMGTKASGAGGEHLNSFGKIF